MATAVGFENWSTSAGLFDRAVTDATPPVYGYYVQHVWQQKDTAGTFSDKERAMTGVHWINTTGGDLDTTWTNEDFALIEAGFQAMWTTLGGFITTDNRLVEHRWYAFGPGVHSPNPPFRVTTVAGSPAGVGTGVNAHQLAGTITFRTPLRRHWGRMYLPLANASSFSAGGTFSPAMVSTFANAGATYVKSGNANGLAPVVWDRNRKVALGITAVEAASIPDIITRRRQRAMNARTVVTS